MKENSKYSLSSTPLKQKKLNKEVDMKLNYEKIKKSDFLGEKSLWQAVVMQAALDATSPATSPEARMLRTKTLTWFSMHNEDFLLVCSFAELIPHEIIRNIRKTAQQTKKFRRRKGVDKFYLQNRVTKFRNQKARKKIGGK